MTFRTLFSLLVFAAFLTLFGSSCVAKKKYEEIQTSQARTEEALNNTRKELATTKRALNKLEDEAAARAKRSTDELLEKNMQITALQKELSSSQSSLKQLQQELSEKENNLEQAQKKRSNLEATLKKREARVAELEAAIKARDDRNKALREKLQEALSGFADSELSVEQKEGRVYVSLSQELLFASGSSYVNRKGKDALKKLAAVLAKNKDIAITVEGHTDNQGDVKSNWQLSTNRANAVLFVLMENEVDAARMTAAGRGPHAPIASNESEEGRAKNRRTEIILQPQLKAIVDLLGAE